MNYVEIRGIVPSWSSQALVETFPTWFDGRIKYVRTRTAQVAVTSGIVKRFDIVGYVDHGKFALSSGFQRKILRLHCRSSCLCGSCSFQDDWFDRTGAGRRCHIKFLDPKI